MKQQTVLVIDGQGGGIGRELTSRLKQQLPASVTLIAVGTNAAATAQMIKAGASAGATGENAAAVNAARADVICGPVGIVLADSLLGEVTPKIAAAVSASPAMKILLPQAAALERCGVMLAGFESRPLGELLDEAVRLVLKAL